MNNQLLTIIFGLKLRQARRKAGLGLSELARRCDLAPSYLTEIEQGRKYPKPDKILKLAEALNTSYNELVSLELAPTMSYLEPVLSSPLFQEFPLETFEVEAIDLIELLTRAPDKAGAFLQAMLEIGRQYNLTGEHILRAALRSYQEIHENYFPDLEVAAQQFGANYQLSANRPVTVAQLQQVLSQEFGYSLDWERLAADERLAGYRSVFVNGRQKRLLLNRRLSAAQIKFLLARELGYQFLGLKDRAIMSAPEEVNSFQQVFNDFKASYFGGALLMPRPELLSDLQTFFAFEQWQPTYLLDLLTRYDVTPEMLLYRFSELIPQFFGLKLHFLRFHQQGQQYRLVKQLNMSRVLLPGGIALHEHFCRRWLLVRLLQELESGRDNQTLAIGAQISEFYESQDHFLCFGFARPLVLSPQVLSSVIIGLRMADDFGKTIHFANDTAIPMTIINETCERCPLSNDQCSMRAVPPVRLEESLARSGRKEALHQLLASLRTGDK